MWLDGLDHVLCVRQAGEAGEQPAVEEGRVEGFGDEDDLKAEPQPSEDRHGLLHRQDEVRHGRRQHGSVASKQLAEPAGLNQVQSIQHKSTEAP